MNDDKWITVDPRSKKLWLRFRVKSFPRQFQLSTGLKDNKRNRDVVRLRRDAITTDIALGQFDPTLERYQFRPSAIAPTTSPPGTAKQQYDLQKLWELYTEFQGRQLAETTILTQYRTIALLINKFPTKSLDDASKIRDWLLTNRGHHVSWNSLNCFRRCCEWANESGLITENPFLKLTIQKPKRSSQKDDYRAFTLEQRDLIIQAFEDDSLHSHYSFLAKFLFWTGCRHGEAFALTWGDVANDCCRISINKSCNGHGIKKGTKNGKKRIFPCQTGSKLQQMLLNYRPKFYNPGDLVFLSKTGRPVNSGMLFAVWSEWRHKNAAGIVKHNGVVKHLANNGVVPYLKPYATRHTFATWAISSGVSPDKVALWIGDEIETVLSYYCHPEIVNAECPEF